MSHHFVDFKEVFFKYLQGKEAIKDVSFRINHGESVGVVGANGAGKSTLLMLLTGILLPEKGEIRIGETPVTKKTVDIIRQRIGYVFQNPDDQLFMPKVYDDVAFGPRNFKLEEQEVEKRVNKALEAAGISHLKERPPYKLSGGEKRAAAIASVLSMDPDILVMDEPTSALDPKARKRLITLLKEFSHTKIIATHDLDMVLEVCGRTIVLSDGKVVCDGVSLKVLSDEKLMEECGLEKPLMLQNCPLCGSLKKN